MITNQSNKFSLNKEIHYLNCAYMSPLMKSVEEEGVREMIRKRNPSDYALDDFFQPADDVKVEFARLINSDKDRMAIIPSVSYGLANAAKNIEGVEGGNMVMVEGQFPSNYYIWKRKCDESSMKLVVVSENSGDWNENILKEISENTAAVVMPQVHWAHGYVFDVAEISKQCKAFNTLLIIDGTQSIGAYPFDQSAIQADAIICAGYKWLLGPYGIGVGYFGPAFDRGIPIEENWLPKIKSDEFQDLTSYQEEFRPKAWRYNVGESSSFIYIAMLKKALEELNKWEAGNIQKYCKSISEKAVKRLIDLGCTIGGSKERAHHLFGILPPAGSDRTLIDEMFLKHNIFVSKRGEYYRISPHVYNDEDDFSALVHAIEQGIG